MASTKQTLVTLEVAKHDMQSDFEINHAERILRTRNNGGWQLPVTSKYTFSNKDGIRIKHTKEEARITK